MSKTSAWIHAALALLVGGGAVYGLGNPVGPLPSALAQALNPSTGVWTSAKAEQLLPQKGQFEVAGLQGKVEILFEEDGTPHIKAENDQDAFAAIGYLHAKFRLFQMDMMRRQGAGLLAEVVGPSAVESDELQRQLGLARTAQAEWDAMKPDDEIRVLLEAYAKGVNQVIDEQTAASDLPMLFKFLGYEPKHWQPQDTLVLKGVLAQMMSFSDMAARTAVYTDKFGAELANELYPVLHENEQRPYDVGPYENTPVQPLALSGEQFLQEKAGKAVTADATDQPVSPAQVAQASVQGEGGEASELLAKAASAAALGLMEKLKHVHPMAVNQNGNSNAWVVDGTKTATGKPLLAGDPHLTFSMPSVWYQLQLTSPGYKYMGATVPGIPMALIGQNEQVSWSMTNGQTQQTFFYKEQTDDAHPNQYFWKGAWRDYYTRTEEIPVKGGGTKTLEVKSTVHGPIVEMKGQTLAMNWTGAMPAPSLDSLLNVMKAKNFDDFKKAFSTWAAPTMNFAFADKAGNIGLIGAGLYPVFPKESKPWLPLRGTGEDDIIGRIAFSDIPQTYNPPNHVIATANQRQVGADYPYYVGSTMTYDMGTRANRIYEVLESKDKLTVEDFAALQADVQDRVAKQIVPLLTEAMASEQMNEQEKAALQELSKWDFTMDENSAAGSIWWKFWMEYAEATYAPWWEKHDLPLEEADDMHPGVFQNALNVNLETWTVKEPNHPFFSNPLTGEKRDASAVMRTAFHEAVKELDGKLGDDVSAWKLGDIRKRLLPSLVQLMPLDYKPFPADGDIFTVNVSSGIRENTRFGPTWRMITDWSTGRSIGNYPGGQSENPLSPWYADRVDLWRQTGHREMLNFAEAEMDGTAVGWTLTGK